MSDTHPVRVLIVDDHELFATSLKLALDRTDGVLCVGIAHTGPDAVALAVELDADVVLMDITLPECDGFEAARRLLAIRRAAKVIALTGLREDEVHDRIASSGMVGYLSKDHVGETVAAAIFSAAARDHGNAELVG
jgi:DNA-binding NarL/FixJ family response regulator